MQTCFKAPALHFLFLPFSGLRGILKTSTANCTCQLEISELSQSTRVLKALKGVLSLQGCQLLVEEILGIWGWMLLVDNEVCVGRDVKGL